MGAADIRVLGAGLLGLAALAGYGFWERISAQPMTPPRLLANRPFVGLNVATLLIYGGLAIMFFVLSFDLIDRRHLAPTQAGLVFLPFTLGVGLLSRLFGAVADKIGARTMLIAGPLAAAVSFIWLALGHDAGLTSGVLAPLGLLGLAMAALVAPLTAAVLSSVADADEGLASGINNAMSRVAQLAGVALAAGLASYTSGFAASMIGAAALAAAGAGVMAATVPRRAGKRGRMR
jgi:predicted MFS family arabinose efflux permease